MARITVEYCLASIPNRFQLVLAATYRARMLGQGHTPRVQTRNKPASADVVVTYSLHTPRVQTRNKPAVTALREIADKKVGLEMLKKVPG